MQERDARFPEIFAQPQRGAALVFAVFGSPLFSGLVSSPPPSLPPPPRAALIVLLLLCLNSCSDDCPFENSLRTVGRECDSSCADGNPYGTLGCSTVGGAYGPLCRACFYDTAMALAQDTHNHRAIM